MENFDELFKPNNIIGVENILTKEIINYVVLDKNKWKQDNVMDWNLFCNHDLSFSVSRIRYVVKLDKYGKIEDSTYFNF